MAKKNTADKRTGSIQVFGNALLRLIEGMIRNNNVDGVIVDIDETRYTAIVKIGTTDFHDVPMRVLISKQASFVEVPKKGTSCAVTFRDANRARPYILEVHECSKILFKVGASTCEVIDGTWTFNGGALGGMVKASASVVQINKIEDDLNALKDVLKVWIPIAQDGGSALKVAASSWYNSKITKTTLSNIENAKIKQ